MLPRSSTDTFSMFLDVVAFLSIFTMDCKAYLLESASIAAFIIPPEKFGAVGSFTEDSEVRMGNFALPPNLEDLVSQVPSSHVFVLGLLYPSDWSN